ncbi:hypothetical protein [uncultured Tenacibaculum sp.]|uniref:hypothetical protein n=1 Tax=uncultured Tenacibaculum sp. TaxID=174713 RepID=UPI0026325145|nr:hypothetical protein [uncultured Tenacibaculum sp.]
MKKSKEELKSYFEKGDKPTQAQYSDLIDSYIDAKQPVGEVNRSFSIDENGEVTIVSEKTIPEYTLSDITNNKLSLLKDGVTVKEIDLTSYIDDTNLSRLVSGEVDEKGIATFKRDDDSTFNVDLSYLKSKTIFQEINNLGNETNQTLVINTSKTTVNNSFNSDSILKTNYDKLGIYIPDLKDVKRKTASENDVFYGGMHRAEYTGVENTKEVFGKYNIGRTTSEGNIHSLGGQINIASYRGTGDITNAIFGTESIARVENRGGTPNIEGVWNRFSASVNHPNAVIDTVVGNSSKIEFQKGNISNAYVHRLDVDNPNVTDDPELLIGDFAYLKADDAQLNFTPTKAHFIHSSVKLPSVLSGTLSTDVTTEVIENASEKTVVTKEYGDKNYKIKVINTGIAQTSISLNTDFPIDKNPVGTIVVNVNSTQSCLFVRFSESLWKKMVITEVI